MNSETDHILYGKRISTDADDLAFDDLVSIHTHKIVLRHLELHEHGHFQDINGYSGGRNWAVKRPQLPTAWKLGSDYQPTQVLVNELVATATALEQGADAPLKFMGWPAEKAELLRQTFRSSNPAVPESKRIGFDRRQLVVMRETDGSTFLTPIDQMSAIENQCGRDCIEWHRVIDTTGPDNVAYTICCREKEVLGIIRY